MIADQQTKGEGSTVEVSLYIVIAGFLILALLQMGSLVGHARLAADQRHERDAAANARREISCFVIGSVQGKQGPDLLQTCGFLKLGAD
jgi:hypothetical protein